MRVSVIIPLYNKERFIRRAIDSIISQTYRDFEVLVVNDGSTDGGEQVVKQYTDKRLTLISQKNLGPGAARNKGISVALAEIVAFLDADDEWLPNYLEEGLRALDRSTPDTAAVCSGYFEFPSGVSSEEMWRKRGIPEGEIKLNSEIDPMLAVHMLAYMSSWSTIARKEVLERWGGFYCKNKCTYAEDAYLWLKVLMNERIRFTRKPLVRYHREASQLTSRLNGPRPIEPFLLDSEDIRAACPEHLTTLLNRILAIRASKTACVLGLWGQHRTARNLIRTFGTRGFYRLPYSLAATILATPIGGAVGQIARLMKRETRTLHDLAHCSRRAVLID